MYNFIKKQKNKVIITLILIMTIITAIPMVVNGATKVPATMQLVSINGNTSRNKGGKVEVGDELLFQITDDLAEVKTVEYRWNYHFDSNATVYKEYTSATQNPTFRLKIPSGKGRDNGYGLLELNIVAYDPNNISQYLHIPFYVVNNYDKADTEGPILKTWPASKTVKIGEPLTFSFEDKPINNSANKSTEIYKIGYKWVTEETYLANPNDYYTTNIQYGKDTITFKNGVPNFPTNIKDGDVYYLQMWAMDGSANYTEPNYWGKYTFKEDVTPPVINGAQDQYIELKDVGSFVAPTLTATDAYDEGKGLTVTPVPNAEEVNNIKKATAPGTYQITYTAKDSSGNEATPVKVTVYVSDYTGLQNAYNKADTLLLGDYNNDKLWAELTTAKQVANTILENKKSGKLSKQDDIDQVQSELNRLIAELSKEENLTNFTKDLTEYKNLVKSDYTTDSWNNSRIESLIKEAEDAVLKSVYEQKLKELKTAKDSLVKASLSDIDEKLQDIKDKVGQLDEKVYTPDSWKKVQDAIKAAEEAKKTGLGSEYGPKVDAIDLSKLTLITMTVDNKTVPSTTEVPLNGGKEINFIVETNAKLENTDTKTITINGLENLPLTQVKEEGPNDGKYTYTLKVSIPNDEESLADITQGAINYTINLSKTVKVLNNGIVGTQILPGSVNGSDSKIIIDTVAPVISFNNTTFKDYFDVVDGKKTGNVTIETYKGVDIKEALKAIPESTEGTATTTDTYDIDILGTYVLRYKAVDAAGNESNILTKRVVVSDYIAEITLSNDAETAEYLSKGLIYGNTFDISKVKVIVKTKTQLDGNQSGEEKTLADIKDIITVTGAPIATTNAGTHEVTVNYVAGNETKTLKFNVTVGKAETIVPDASQLPQTSYKATYGDLLNTIKLPAGWTFDSITNKGETDPEPTVGNATTVGNEFQVTYKAKDLNHKDVTGKVTIEVAKATPSYTLPTGLTATYGDTLADVSLTEGWTYVDADTTSVGDAGNNEFEVVFTPSDTDNYSTVTGQKVTIVVGKKQVNAILPTLSSNYKDTPKEIKATIAGAITDVSIEDLGTITYIVKNDRDEIVTLLNTTPAGTYTITAIASNENYDVKFTNGTYTINRIDPKVSDLKVSIPEGLVYDGTAKTATVTSDISEINNAITVKYDNSETAPVNAGTYAVTVDIAETTNYNAATALSLGNLSIGKLEIKPEHFQTSKTVYSVEGDGNPKSYPIENITSTLLGNQINGKITIVYRDSERNKVPNPTKVGTYIVKIIVEDGDNFFGTDGREINIGTSEVSLKIVEKTLSSKTQVIVTADKVEATYAEDTTVTLDESTINVSIKESETITKPLTKGTDYTITDITYRNETDETTTKLPENAAEYTAIITIKLENYSFNGSNVIVKEIDAVKINKANNAPTLEIINATYGQTLENVKDQLPAGWAFIRPQDYVGNATVEGAYNTADVEYTPADTTNYNSAKGKVQIRVAKADSAPELPEEPYEATYGDKLNTIVLPEGWAFVNEDGTAIDVTNTTVGNATVEDGYNTFNVKYTPKNTNNYNTAEGTIKITVAKANPSYTTPSGLTATYGQKLKDVTLPTATNGTFTWVEDEGTSVGNAGENTFHVKFTPNDKANYNTIESIEVKVTVSKINPSYTTPSGLTADYNETLADVELPVVENGTFTWVEDEGTSVGNAGENTFHVKFTPNDKANYNTIESIEVKVTVSKINPSYTVPSGLTATYGQTLADITLPTATNGTFTWVEDEGTSVGNAGENTFHVKFTPNDTTNYNIIESIEVKVTVVAASVPADDTLKDSLTVTMPGNLVYNKEPKSATVTSTIEGLGKITVKCYQNGMEVEPINAGTYDIKITIAPSTNYAGTPNGTVIDLGQTMTIEKEEITIEIHNKTSKYGETIEELTYKRTAGTKYDGDILGVTLTAERELTTETPVGAYKITGIAANTNYDVTFVDGTYTITQAPSTFPTLADIAMTYDAEATVGSITMPKVANGTITFAESVDQTAKIGDVGTKTYAVVYTPDDDNFATAEGNITVVVNKAGTDIPDDSKLPDEPKPGDDDYDENYADYTATYGDLLDMFSYKADATDKANRLPAGWTFDKLDGKTAEEIANIYVGSATIGTEANAKTPAIHEFAVTYKGDENHADVTDTVKIKVVKANNAPTLPEKLTATYGQALSEFAYDETVTDTDAKANRLPAGWAFDPIFEGEGADKIEVINPTVGNAGTNTFKVTYTPADPDNYNTAEGTVTIEVARKDVSDKTLDELVEISIEMDEELVYNGMAQEPVITPKTDVTVSKEVTYSKYDKEAGSYKQIAEIPSDIGDYRAIIKIEGSENYTGSIGEKTVYYSITPREVTVKPTSQSGENATAIYGDENIAVKQGEYTYTTATSENTFGLLEELGHKLEGVTLITPTLTEAKSRGLYDIEIDPENVKIVIKADGTDAIVKDVTANYIINYEKLEDGFEIKPKSIEAPNFNWDSALIFPDGRTFTYTGNNQGVSINPPAPLVLNQDILPEIVYRKGSNPGSATTATETKDVGTYWVTVKITGKGNYEGEVNLNNGEAINFEIIKAPAPLEDSQIPTLTAEYGQTLADVKMIKGTGAEAVFENRPWTLWDAKGNALGTFDYNTGTNINGGVGTVANPAKVTLKYTSANDNYSPVTREVTLAVTPATPNVTVPTGLTATYGDLLSSVNLGEGWTFDDITVDNKDTLTVGDATPEGEDGTAFDVTYRPTDLNYKEVTGKTVIIKVNKKGQTKPIVSLVNAVDEIISDNSILMIDKETKVKVSNVGEAGEGINYSVTAGTAVEVSNTGIITPKAIGNATVKVTFPGNNNYLPAEKDIEITVTKAKLKDTDFVINGVNTHTYSGTAYGVNVNPADGIVCENNNIAVTPVIKYDGSTDAPVNARTYRVTIDVPESENYEAKTDLFVGTMTIEKAQISSLERAEQFLNISLKADNEFEWTGSEIALVDSVTPKFETDSDITLGNSVKYYYGATEITGIPSGIGEYTAYLKVNSSNIETVTSDSRGIELGSYWIKDTTKPTFKSTDTKASISENIEETELKSRFDEYAAGTDNHDGNITATWTGEIEQNVNGSYKLGTYEITFTLKDSSGNTATKVVEVTVIEAPPRIYYLDTTKDTGNRWDLLDEEVQTKLLNNPSASTLHIEWNRGTGTIYKTNDNGKTWVVSEYGANLPAKTTVPVGKGGYYKVVVTEPGLDPVEARFKISDINPVYRFSDSRGRNEFVGLYSFGDTVTFTIENPETVALLKIVPENDPDFKEVNLSSFGTGTYTFTFTGPDSSREYAAYNIYLTPKGGDEIYIGEVFYCDLAALRNQ